jgi:hypothetical protein
MSDLPDAGGETPQTNTPEITVSELANALKRSSKAHQSPAPISSRRLVRVLGL